MIMYAMREDYLSDYLHRTQSASTEKLALATSMFSNVPLDDIVSINEAGDQATIMITGPLTVDGPDFLDRLFGFGGTSYNAITHAAISLKKNDSIKKVRMLMATPGGTTDGVGQAHRALLDLAATKELIAENHGEISSAGYFLAVAAHKIIAMSAMVLTGSIGIVAAGLDISEALERDGIKRIKIVSANAPNKQADVTTDSGLEVVRDEINSIERIFIDIVATGRNTTKEDVIANFGKGAVLVANDPDESMPDAISVGMIDGVINTDDVPPANDSGKLEGTIDMDINELQANHPAVFAEAVQRGVTMERMRVDAHVKLGAASGDVALALKNIEDGVEHSAVSNALYTAAQINRQTIADRNADNVGDVDTDNGDVGGDTPLAIAAAQALGVTLNG
jgi:ClpP class serine protease